MFFSITCFQEWLNLDPGGSFFMHSVLLDFTKNLPRLLSWGFQKFNFLLSELAFQCLYALVTFHQIGNFNRHNNNFGFL